MTSAFRFVWRERGRFSRGLALPGLLLLLLVVGWSYARQGLEWVNLVGIALYVVVFAVFAVTCHRLVLLQRTPVGAVTIPPVTARELRFLGWLIVVWAIALGSMMLFVTVLANILLGIDRVLADFFGIVLKAGVTYIFARLCMVFPATAVDQRPNLKWSWEFTRGNGWRLAIIVGVLPWVIKEVISLLFRAEATLAETVLLGLAGVALMAVEVAALSLAYRYLMDQRPLEPDNRAMA